MLIDLPRVHFPALADESQKRLRFFLTLCWPRQNVIRRNVCIRGREHQSLNRSRSDTVVDEKVTRDGECCIAALEIVGSIVFGRRTQRQIVGAGRSVNGIGLNKTNSVQRSLKSSRGEKALRYPQPPQCIKRDQRFAP